MRTAQKPLDEYKHQRPPAMVIVEAESFLSVIDLRLVSVQHLPTSLRPIYQ